MKELGRGLRLSRVFCAPFDRSIPYPVCSGESTVTSKDVAAQGFVMPKIDPDTRVEDRRSKI